MSDQSYKMETREVSGFSNLDFRGMGKIELTQGDHEELVIEAMPEVRERIRTEVRNDTLVISYDSDWKDWTGIRFLEGDKVIFRLMMREINGIGIAGVGSLDSPLINTGTLTVSLSGPGSLTIGTVNASVLNLKLSGVGSVDVAGETKDLSIELSGAGSVRASRLKAENASVRLSGVGSATIWAVTSLDASLSGAGVIEYYGSPQIHESRSGLGVLKYLGNR
jgi:hypothetical protein